MQNVAHTPWSSVTPHSDIIDCDWQTLSSQLLEQWHKLSPTELERTGQNRHKMAELIYEKYGVHPVLVENYLKNLERTLPLFH